MTHIVVPACNCQDILCWGKGNLRDGIGRRLNELDILCRRTKCVHDEGLASTEMVCGQIGGPVWRAVVLVSTSVVYFASTPSLGCSECADGVVQTVG
jgi:hypothetical protein